MIAIVALVTTLAAQDPVTTIVARDFTLEAPERIPGPLVRLRFENAGREPHYVRFLRLRGDHTLDDFARWRKTRTPLPDWLSGVGGPGTIGPGESIEFTAELPLGTYIIMCGHPSPDGVQHVDQGMYRMVTVTYEGRVISRQANTTLVLRDHAIDVFGELRPGERQYLIVNQGATTHQALVVLLPDGVSVEQELDWFRSRSKGVRPGQPVGGAIEVLPGQEARVVLNLRPGRYVLFCSVPGGGKRHFDLGMMRAFEIPKQ